MSSVFTATVEKVIPTDHPLNKNGNQYEYNLLVDYYDFTSLPINNVRRADEFGAGDDFNDVILSRGQRVLVACPRNQLYGAFIIAGIRSSFKKTNPALAHHSLRRFNEIENLIDNRGTWSIKSDEGPTMSLGRNVILLDASSGDSIEINKETKQINIKTNEWNVNVAGNATINVSGDTQITSSNATANIKNSLTVQCDTASVTAKSNVNVTAQKVIVDAKKIQLAGEKGQVLTTETQPVCYVTGIPFIGSKKVTAGN